MNLSAEEGVLSFEAPSQDTEFPGCLALTQAMMRHLDFLFTRAPALDWMGEETERCRLLLSRVVLDLTGRPPTMDELNQFVDSWNWDETVAHYLATRIFVSFATTSFVALFGESRH
ncbi:MAG: hypothetical protein M2R45_01588 [Verrucomicrobia subdivision 3 bacterium]|nr:hypothetical protein [Limisphaerales bacterium]MCS1412741.1 hypothetical protein [Limisphaerales bacterium]